MSSPLPEMVAILSVIYSEVMFPLMDRRKKALFGQKVPSGVFAMLVTLPLGVILAFVLLAVVATTGGLPGAELAADGLLNALVMVGLAQGAFLLFIALFLMLCFIDCLWKSRAALWPIACDLFPKTADLMRMWRALWTPAPSVLALSTGHFPEYESPAPERVLTGAFTPGLTPQLE